MDRGGNGAGDGSGAPSSSVSLLGVLLLKQTSLLADAAGHVRHLVVVAVSDASAVERSHQVMHLLAATNQRAKWKLVIRSLLFDLTNFVCVGPDRLEHSAHAANEANLLLEDLHAVLLGLGFLGLLVLLLLLLF